MKVQWQVSGGMGAQYGPKHGHLGKSIFAVNAISELKRLLRMSLPNSRRIYK